MSTEKFNVNKEQIENQVKKEILAEQKYWQQNSAKLRAVEQRVPTYEDFRQMVLASHLKPLDKGESFRDNLNRNNVWNSLANTNSSDPNFENLLKESNAELEKQKEILINNKPKSSLDFIKTWNLIEDKHDEKTKWQFLNKLGADSIKSIFKAEINGDMLGKFIILFEKKLSEQIENEEKLDISFMKENLDLIFDLLKCFIQCKRFSLNLMFLKESEINALKRIISFFENKSNIEKNKLTFYEVNEECIKYLKSSYLT